jgi:glycogen synthase
VTLLEALAVGCVPICSPVGGIVNVIQNGENGILSKSSSFEDYLETMKDYLNLTLSDIAALNKNAKESFDPYNITKTAKHYLEYYREKLTR